MGALLGAQSADASRELVAGPRASGPARRLTSVAIVRDCHHPASFSLRSPGSPCRMQGCTAIFVDQYITMELHTAFCANDAF
ncbi:hypothetical protein MTO96_006100 [Rhipicephalus appendiculatus]